ncbi:MAG: hypothetical protein Q4B25_10070, partial [Pseudomonadota bacterium]|nr:hypothetical protein [Pseudomonadota bacterium]
MSDPLRQYSAVLKERHASLAAQLARVEEADAMMWRLPRSDQFAGNQLPDLGLRRPDSHPARHADWPSC